MSMRRSTTANILSETKNSAFAKESRPYRLSPIIVARRHRKFRVTFSIHRHKILSKQMGTGGPMHK